MIRAVSAAGLLLLLAAPAARAQSTGDSATARSALPPDARLATPLVRQDTPILSIDSLEGFVRFVGTPRQEAVDEPLRNETMHIDGPPAVVRTEYSLYVPTRFSHCGVAAFQLARTAAGWKIFPLADTRRRQGCPDQP